MIRPQAARGEQHSATEHGARQQHGGRNAR